MSVQLNANDKHIENSADWVLALVPFSREILESQLTSNTYRDMYAQD